MTHVQPARTLRRTPLRWGRVAGLLLAAAALVAAAGQLLPASTSSTSTASTPATWAAEPGDASPPRAAAPAPSSAPTRAPASASSPPRRARLSGGALGVAGGAIPDGTTPFDTGVPGVARLDPALRRALRDAATAAGRVGVRLQVDSGWRSAAYQRHLLDDAVARYGSEAEAARWVASPERSLHVSGDAVDVGPTAAAAWLSAHGAAYGLCRVYGNEPWHFERRVAAARTGCPPLYADPPHDPRLQP